MTGFTLWAVWALIGIIGGYMGGRLLSPHGQMIVTILIAIVGAVLGGWLFILIFGSEGQNTFVSLLTSMGVGALSIWAITAWQRKHFTDDDYDDY